ncbi:hypothetical protein BH11PSE3_BH11PSE3_39900 [soil metagenome]
MNRLLLAVTVAAVTLPALATATLAQAPTRRGPPEPTECAAQGPLKASWGGEVFAIDGNTLCAVGLKPHLRIWGIQAPELRDAAGRETVAGMRARAALEDLLYAADHKVKCRALRYDDSCRMVAQCSLDDGKGGDLGGALIAAGLAYGFRLDEILPWETRASQRYASAEAEARKQGRGLWKEWLGDT